MHISFDALTDSINTSLLPTTIDGLVYCPGSINLRPFKGLKPEAFESDLQLNFISLIKVIQSVLPNLLAAEQASIVLFSSVAAMMGMPFHTSVAASKGAIEGFAKALAAEYAPKIRVNVIAPSLTDTPLAEKFLNNETKQEKSAERHPLKRFGKPEDSAQMTSFLLSDKSSWITGQIFHVDGGMSTLLING
ncbi:short chain dehydrogenase [Flavobacterium cauense R2A-7]|nr:short chain dehydrogenase [Flavobacterium cauense R2A-7]